MRISVISFTRRGGRLAEKLCAGLSRAGHEARGYIKMRAGDKAPCPEEGALVPVEEPLSRWTEKAFASSEGLVFVGACGIAVRAVAPFIADKFKDPAVVVMDEGGSFAVSLLSGHVGGGNMLARLAADLAGAVPVITTATDVNGKFAVDVFAKENGLSISERELAKEASARILAGERLPFYSVLPLSGRAPGELEVFSDLSAFLKRPGLKIAVSERRLEGEKILYLIPRLVTLGTGCRRGISPAAFKEQITECLKEAGIFKEALEALATIELKKDEEAIRSLAKEWGLGLKLYTVEQLKAVPGAFTASAFVEKTVGVDSVCERAAAAEGRRLILRKQAKNGVTAAAAVREYPIAFEKESSH